MTFGEIAAELGISNQAVCQAYHRAMQKLRRRTWMFKRKPLIDRICRRAPLGPGRCPEPEDSFDESDLLS